MTSCACRKHPFNSTPKIFKYPCKIPEVETDAHPCREVGLEDLQKQREEEAERKKSERKKPCPDAKPPSKKRFLQLVENNCALPYSRKWNLEEEPCRRPDEAFPKWFKRRPKKYDDYCLECPRELDDYEKKLWIPVCKKVKEERPVEREPVDQSLCVFCLGCLYTGGFLHELHEKVPLVLEQSKINGDEVASRIGIRTRVVVHRKCYKPYTDPLAREKETENGEKEEDTEEDEDSDFCGEGKEESEEEVVNHIPPPTPNFCLKKYQPPPLDPGLRSWGHRRRNKKTFKY